MSNETNATPIADRITWVILSNLTPNRATVERILGLDGRPSDADMDRSFGTRDAVEVGERVWAGQFIGGW